MHCDHCVYRYERESAAVEVVCVVSLNYGHCDTATRSCATEWSLRVTATQLLKKGDMSKYMCSKGAYFSTLCAQVVGNIHFTTIGKTNIYSRRQLNQ